MNPARGTRRQRRGHLAGLSALAREIEQRFPEPLTPKKEEAYECWIVYFFSKILALPLPKNPEAEMHSDVVRLFKSDRAKKYRELGTSFLKNRVQKRDIVDIRRASEHVEDAMSCYERAFTEAHGENARMLSGGFESGRK